MTMPSIFWQAVEVPVAQRGQRTRTHKATAHPHPLHKSLAKIGLGGHTNAADRLLAGCYMKMSTSIYEVAGGRKSERKRDNEM